MWNGSLLEDFAAEDGLPNENAAKRANRYAKRSEFPEALFASQDPSAQRCGERCSERRRRIWCRDWASQVGSQSVGFGRKARWGIVRGQRRRGRRNVDAQRDDTSVGARSAGRKRPTCRVVRIRSNLFDDGQPANLFAATVEPCDHLRNANG